jgi:hypothetical protein
MDDTRKAAPLAETVSELRASFPDIASRDAAVEHLTTNGFDRADLTMPDAADADAPPVTETDQRQARTLGTSLGASAGALAAAGAVIASGGALLPAVGAAVAGAAAAGALGGAAASTGEQQDTATAEGLVLTVRLADAGKRAAAEAALRAAGATRLELIERRIG